MGPSVGYRNVPPRRRGVLLPVDDRRTAALGVCLYTTCNLSSYLVQQTAFWAVRLLGARAVPEPTIHHPEELGDVVPVLDDVARTLGASEHVAIYRRKQAERTGVTMVAVRRGRPLALIKVRERGDALAREQAVLAWIQRHPRLTFRAPAPLGQGLVGGDRELHWSAQSMVFTRPHRPQLAPPEQLFAEVSDAVATFVGEPVPGLAPSHNDLTPWNLRRDHRGTTWLFDWEDAGLAPAGADQAYFSACLHALRGTPLPQGLPPEGVAHWRAALLLRQETSPSDQALTAALLGALTDLPRAAGRIRRTP